jgi:hypothetical protein
VKNCMLKKLTPDVTFDTARDCFGIASCARSPVGSPWKLKRSRRYGKTTLALQVAESAPNLAPELNRHAEHFTCRRPERRGAGGGPGSG